MSARCDDCGRIVPPEQFRDGPYVDGAGRWHCGTCITETLAQVERFWSELRGTEPLSAADILRRIAGRDWV